MTKSSAARVARRMPKKHFGSNRSRPLKMNDTKKLQAYSAYSKYIRFFERAWRKPKQRKVLSPKPLSAAINSIVTNTARGK